MILASNDHDFLDRVVTKIFEMTCDRLTAYPGYLETYLQLLQGQHERQIEAYGRRKEHVEEQEEYVRRVDHGQLHKQAASRRKQPDKIESVERPTIVDAPLMHFGAVRRSGDAILDIQNLSKAS